MLTLWKLMKIKEVFPLNSGHPHHVNEILYSPKSGIWVYWLSTRLTIWWNSTKSMQFPPVHCMHTYFIIFLLNSVKSHVLSSRECSQFCHIFKFYSQLFFKILQFVGANVRKKYVHGEITYKYRLFSLPVATRISFVRRQYINEWDNCAAVRVGSFYVHKITNMHDIE